MWSPARSPIEPDKGMRGAEEVAGAAADPHRAAGHLAGRIGVGAAADLDRAGAHADPQVGARMTFDAQLAGDHAGADAVELAAVALDDEARAAGAAHVEPVADAAGAPPVAQRQMGHGVGAPARDLLGRQARQIEPELRCAAQPQGQGLGNARAAVDTAFDTQGSSSRSLKWNLPSLPP
jgi:hypothetical protein